MVFEFDVVYRHRCGVSSSKVCERDYIDPGTLVLDLLYDRADIFWSYVHHRRLVEKKIESSAKSRLGRQGCSRGS